MHEQKNSGYMELTQEEFEGLGGGGNTQVIIQKLGLPSVPAAPVQPLYYPSFLL